MRKGIGAIALVLMLGSAAVRATGQTKTVERQMAAAKRQRESMQARQKTERFFQTPWLGEESGADTPVPPDCTAVPPEELQALISRTAVEGVSPSLVRAVIEQESAGRPCAVSSKGAMGLMQIMPELARELNVDDAFDPEQNMRAGTRHLAQLMTRYSGDLPKVLAAYNAGAARVDSSGGVPDIAETQAYVKSIMAKLDRD